MRRTLGEYPGQHAMMLECHSGLVIVVESLGCKLMCHNSPWEGSFPEEIVQKNALSRVSLNYLWGFCKGMITMLAWQAHATEEVQPMLGLLWPGFHFQSPGSSRALQMKVFCVFSSPVLRFQHPSYLKEVVTKASAEDLCNYPSPPQ